MGKLSSSTGALLLGIAIFLVGCIQPSKYEDAKENGYEVDATIVEVDESVSTGMDGAPDSTVYTVYADYEVDGEEYHHVKVGKYYDTDAYYVGKTIQVVVDPEKPGKPMFEGGILCTVGFLIAVAAIIHRIKKKRKKET